MSQRGFTFVELCLGLVMTSLIAGAIASFMVSVSRCWNESEELQTAAIRANQFTERLAGKLRGAKRIGYWNAGNSGTSACLTYWCDTNNDEVMQQSELGAINYEPTTHTIDSHVPVVPPGDPDTTWTSADFSAASAATTLVASSKAKPLVRNVGSAELAVSNATSDRVAPTVSWVLNLTEADSSVVTRVCATSLRAPATPP
jgi:type II secretory pathway pseudopilin PulG